MPSETFTLSHIADAAHQRLRTVQFWADRNVFVGEDGREKKSRGSKRRYPASELKVAAVAGRLHEMNCSISEIVEVISQIRKYNLAANNIAYVSQTDYELDNRFCDIRFDDARRCWKDYLSEVLGVATTLCTLTGSFGSFIRLIIVLDRDVRGQLGPRVVLAPYRPSSVNVDCYSNGNTDGFKLLSLPLDDVCLIDDCFSGITREFCAKIGPRVLEVQDFVAHLPPFAEFDASRRYADEL